MEFNGEGVAPCSDQRGVYEVQMEFNREGVAPCSDQRGVYEV